MIRASIRFVALALALANLAGPLVRAQDALPPGHAPVSDEALRRALGEGPPIAQSEPSASVPIGAVDVTVVDEREAPVAGARVRLGSMAEGARGPERFATTDSSGNARFSGLTTGRGAHRVTLDHEGARYLTAPFVLADASGQRVRIRRLPTTRDQRLLLQRIGRTVVEFQKPGRLHITQVVELMNLGESTLVLPEGGLAIPLPTGFLAFESERSMNDQRIAPTATGFALNGSLPPGRLQLGWSYDLPFSGSEASFSQRVPFAQTAAYQVIVDAADDMHLDVTGFPDSRFIEYQGKNLLYTERELTPDDAPLRQLRIKIRGIPGSFVYRWIAILGALVLLAWGLRLATTRGDAASIARDERARHEAALLDEVARLAADHAAGDVGEAFFARERERIVDELALIAKRNATSSPAPS